MNRSIRKKAHEVQILNPQKGFKSNAKLERLIVKAMRGNREAMIALCEMTAKSVLFRVAYIMENHADAEDVAQEVMIRMCTGIRDLKSPWAFSVWLNRIILSETNRYYANKSRNGTVLSIDDYIENLQEEKDDFLPYDYLNRKDIRGLVMNIIRELPERQRQVLLLYYYDGMGVTEIAEAIGTSKPTISIALKRARHNIRKKIESMPGMEGIITNKLSVIPTGSLLKQILKDETIINEFASNMWVQKAVASCQAQVSQSALFGKTAFVVSKPLVIFISAVAATGVIYFNLPSEAPQETEIPASTPAVEQVVSEDAIGKIIFEGSDSAGEHINPQKATVLTDSNHGGLTIQGWEISDLESGTVIRSGKGDTVEAPLTEMYSQGENGHYMLRFYAKDITGRNYTIGNSFIIYAK